MMNTSIASVKMLPANRYTTIATMFGFMRYAPVVYLLPVKHRGTSNALSRCRSKTIGLYQMRIIFVQSSNLMKASAAWGQKSIVNHHNFPPISVQ